MQNKFFSLFFEKSVLFCVKQDKVGNKKMAKYQESKYDKVIQKMHQICSPGHHGVKNVTLEKFNDKDFQKWWAHHPWRMIRVDEGKAVMHINMLNVYAAMLFVIAVGLATGFIDAVKWQQYKHQKVQLTEKQIQDKYSDFQIARYDAYTKLQQKIKQ